MARNLFVVDNGAEVRPAEDLAALAARINAEHDAGEGATRKGLEHFRAAGEALLRAKGQCGHGKWLAWLKKNVRCSQQRASEYMRVAQNWDKLPPGGNLKDALRLLIDDVAEEEVAAPDPAPPRFVTLEQWEGMAACVLRRRRGGRLPARSTRHGER